jgi:amino acid adenylation domain-containing protein
MTAAERRQLLVDWNDTRVDYPRDKCVHQLFEEQVERTPDARAVVFEDQSLSYGELNRRANQLAHYLRKLGVGPDVLVGVCMERSLEMVIGLLGILKAGGAYVPLDPEYPKERLRYMIDDAHAPVLLTQQHLLALFPQIDIRSICLDRDWNLIACECAENVEEITGPHNLAYMIYTSGSTGKPKGVLNAHQGICNCLLWMQSEYQLNVDDAILQQTAFSFDVSVWEFFWPLLVGARLVLAKPGGHRDAAYLAKLITEQQITLVHFVPSMLRIFLEEPSAQGCCSLCNVICIGEALPYELQEQFFGLLPARLHNLYGPTEAAVEVTRWTCQRHDERAIVPIGRPIANTQVYILNNYLQPVPIGIPGELHIGGIQVALGYHNLPELTLEKFIADPFTNDTHARLYKTGDSARYLPDGNIEFLGRIDHQVKVRGFRIELGEIEAVLSQHSAIRECMVVAHKNKNNEKQLVAYLALKAAQIVPVNELRSFLKSKLPEYMIPAAFVFLESFPLAPNGKVDRHALPPPDTSWLGSPDEFVAPQTPTEERLAAIWADLLGIDKISAHDNFFELGGHSLLAVRLFARIEREFGKKLPLSTLFEEATLEKLACLVTQESSPNLSGAAVQIRAGVSGQPLFLMHSMTGDLLLWRSLVQHLDIDRTIYGLQLPYRNGHPQSFSNIRSMATHHVECIRNVQKEGPYYLAGYSFGGRVALEIAQQLVEGGQMVGLLAIIDAAPFDPAYPTFFSYIHHMLRFLLKLPYWITDDLLLSSHSDVMMRMKRNCMTARKRLKRFFSGGWRSAQTADLEDYFPLNNVSESYQRMMDIHFQAWNQYVCSSYPGRVHLFLPRAYPVAFSSDLKTTWTAVAQKGVDVKTVRGSHHNIMNEPQVYQLASLLKASLIEADENLM